MILLYDYVDLLFHQTLLGDIGNASKTLKRYHSVWKKFGFTPEFYQITAGLPIKDRESYPLRPGRLYVYFPVVRVGTTLKTHNKIFDVSSYSLNYIQNS